MRVRTRVGVEVRVRARGHNKGWGVPPSPRGRAPCGPPPQAPRAWSYGATAKLVLAALVGCGVGSGVELRVCHPRCVWGVLCGRESRNRGLQMSGGTEGDRDYD